MGTDILFENHTITEIQDIEKKLRHDIEHKKEELRHMVGERYRDLMEAADTITEMKEIAESITICIRSIEDSCLEMQNGSLQKGILNSIKEEVSEKRKANEMLYAVAAQIKILMDSPTKIWCFIERKDFVCAISLYLLARHTHSLLLLDPIYREKNILAQFPVINRQWTSVSHFRHVLLEDSQSILKTQDTESEDAVGALCCSCLLSNKSLQEVFLDFLNIRKDVLKSVFRHEKSAKAQMCEFVTVIHMTMQLVYVLFYPKDQTDYKTNLLHQTLVKLTSKDQPGPVTLLDMDTSTIFKFLPSEIINFRPIVSASFEPCTAEFLQTKCSEWLNYIKSNLKADLEGLLTFVTSVQSLSIIREAIYDKLCEMTHWDEICNNLLNGPFSIWNSYLKDCFWKHINNIINEQVKSASEFCQKDMEETLYKISSEERNSTMEFEKNVSLYVWMESPNDVMDNIAWQPRHHRNYWNSGELSMKAMGFTPRVQSISKDLDDRLRYVLEDICYFSHLQSKLPDKSIEKAPAFEKVALELSTNANDIYKYLWEAAEKYIFDLPSYVETTLLYLEKENDSFENNCRIVFLGHLCYGIANLCPHINCCLSPEKLSECVERCVRQGTKITFSVSSFKENESWKDLKKKFLDLNSSAFKIWSKHQIRRVIRSVNSELDTCSIEGLLKSLLQWDKIDIQEESEQGTSVSSVLRIPQHISTPLSNALFKFCCELNSVGGFSMSSEIRSDISKELLLGLLEVYKEKMNVSAEKFNSRLLQVQSLQLLFDVQFLTSLLVHKSNACDRVNDLSQEIIDRGVSYVDPFDMDVFAVPLQQNIKKALQRSLSLFGLLTSPDQVSYLNSTKSHQLSSQMDHNIMLISNAGSRFPLLPLSSKSSAINIVPPEQFSDEPKEVEVKNLSSHNSSPNLSDSDTSTNPMKTAASFYNKVMSSSWFGN